jgi:hypothetical protein
MLHLSSVLSQTPALPPQSSSGTPAPTQVARYSGTPSCYAHRAATDILASRLRTSRFRVCSLPPAPCAHRVSLRATTATTTRPLLTPLSPCAPATSPQSLRAIRLFVVGSDLIASASSNLDFFAKKYRVFTPGPCACSY